MLFNNPLVAIFLAMTSALPTLSVSIHASAPRTIDQPSGVQPQLQSLSTKNPPPMLELLDCHVPGSQVTVRYALKARRVSAPRMHDLLVKAITFTFQQRTESGQAPDPTFEFDGVGANKWYFIDVEETSDGALTWDNLSRTFEGLLICVFHRRLYYAIRFEIWEGNDTDAIHVGTGEFDTLRQTALQ